MQKPDPIFVTIPRAVEVSGCARTRIYDALKRGHLTARKAGRRTLISYAELRAYLASLPAYEAQAGLAPRASRNVEEGEIESYRFGRLIRRPTAPLRRRLQLSDERPIQPDVDDKGVK